jgi:hypothetical protein
MKDGLRHIVGKRIAAVVVAESPRPPRQQVVLVFDDGTRFEFWGESFSCCSGVDQAAGIIRDVKSAGGKVTRVYRESMDSTMRERSPFTTGPDPIVYHVPAPENQESIPCSQIPGGAR